MPAPSCSPSTWRSPCSSRGAQFGRGWRRAHPTRLPASGGAPQVRHRDRRGHHRQRPLHADDAALLPGDDRPRPGGDRVRALALGVADDAGGLRDRLDGRHLRSAQDDAARQPGAGGRDGGLPLVRLAPRRGAVDDPAQPRPPGLLGVLRQRRHGHLGAGGARAVVRLPPGRAQPGLLSRRGARGRGPPDRHRPGLPDRGRRQRRHLPPRLRPAARRPRPPGGPGVRGPGRGLGSGAAGPAVPAPRGRPVRLRGRDDGAQLRAAGLRRRGHRPARLGGRRHLHAQHRHGRTGPGAGGPADDRSGPRPDDGAGAAVLRRRATSCSCSPGGCRCGSGSS